MLLSGIWVIHILNINLSLNHLLLSPIILLPHFIAGILYGFIRLKYGFLWGLILHILYNSMVFSFQKIIFTI